MSQPPEWEHLQAELADLVLGAEAFNAYVFDVWNNFWCAAHSYAYAPDEELARLIQLVAKERHVALTHGGHLDTALSVPDAHLFVKTYGSCYVLLLRFAGDFSVEQVRSRVHAAIPRIEALTLLLPPPDGPESDGGARSA